MLKNFFGDVKGLDLSEKLLLVLIFVLPFERIPSYDVAGLTLKLSLLVSVVLILINLKKVFAQPKEFGILARLPRLLLEYSLLSILWAENLHYWLKANLILGFCVALFCSVFIVVRKAKDRERLLELAMKTVLVSTGAIIAFGLFQWFGNLLGLPHYLTAIRPEYTADKLGLPRMHSVLLEPLYFGLFLLLPLGILWADRAGLVIKNLYLRFGFITLIYLSILLSLARGAIVASALVGILGLVYNFGELKKQLKLKDVTKIAGVGIAALAVLVVSTSLLGVKGRDEDHNYGRGFSTIVGHLETIKPWGNKEDKEKQDSINSRDEARSEAIDVITKGKDNLIFGVGAGQYGTNLNPPKGFEATSNFVLLDVWAEYGLVGLGLLVTFLAGLLTQAVKRVRCKSLKPVELVLVVGIGFYLVGFLLQSITFGEVAITHLWVGLALLSAVVLTKD